MIFHCHVFLYRRVFAVRVAAQESRGSWKAAPLPSKSLILWMFPLTEANAQPEWPTGCAVWLEVATTSLRSSWQFVVRLGCDPSVGDFSGTRRTIAKHWIRCLPQWSSSSLDRIFVWLGLSGTVWTPEISPSLLCRQPSGCSPLIFADTKLQLQGGHIPTYGG